MPRAEQSREIGNVARRMHCFFIGTPADIFSQLRFPIQNSENQGGSDARCSFGELGIIVGLLEGQFCRLKVRRCGSEFRPPSLFSPQRFFGITDSLPLVSFRRVFFWLWTAFAFLCWASWIAFRFSASVFSEESSSFCCRRFWRRLVISSNDDLKLV